MIHADQIPAVLYVINKMLSDITTGNAVKDGSEFHYWFVGQVGKWCRDNNQPFDAERYGLRNTEDIEIKWGIYKKGDVRPVWAQCSEMTAMSILIRGDFTFTFREPRNHGNNRNVRLKNEGDYVIWTEDTEHTWKMYKDSVIVTLRWRSSDFPLTLKK
jgi:hypothetical protein